MGVSGVEVEVEGEGVGVGVEGLEGVVQRLSLCARGRWGVWRLCVRW